jgi:lipopolysaccharide export system permease protein
VSRLQLALPVLAAAAVGMAMTYACSLYLMPLGQRVMKDKVFDIRADIGAAILKEGAFTTPSDGLTVFIRELAPSGEIRGILVHDNRQPQRPITYLAESGTLVQTREGVRLVMVNGNIEQGEARGSRLSVLRFDRYVFDLDQYGGPQRASDRDTSERYLTELLDPRVAANGPSVRRGVYLAEAHNRLSAPFYCLAFALIALAATAKGRLARASYALRLSGAALFGAALRLAGYAAQGLAARRPELNFLLYLLPVLGILLASAALHDIPLFPPALRRRFSMPAGEPA